MFLANDVQKSWGLFLQGDPVEIISARDKSAIIIRCQGDTLTVSSFDITDVQIKRDQPPVPKAPAPKSKSRRK